MGFWGAGGMYGLLGFLLEVHEDDGCAGEEGGPQEGELRGAGHGDGWVVRGCCGLLRAHSAVGLGWICREWLVSKRGSMRSVVA